MSSRKRSQRAALNNSLSKFVNTALDLIQIGDTDNMPMELAEAEIKIEGDSLKQKEIAKDVESNLNGKSKTMATRGIRKKKKSVKDVQGSKTVIKGGLITKNQKVKGKDNTDKKTKTVVGKSTKRKEKASEDVVVKNNKKKKVTKEWHGIRTRSSPHQLFRAVSGMKTKQREAVKRMGFGKLLTFKVDGIPSKLGHYVVDMLDTERMEINLGANQIKVDKASIHQLLGLPNTGINLTSFRKPKEHDSIFLAWKERNVKSLAGAKEIADRIIESNDEDGMMFKIDFIVLFSSTMINCHKNGLCRHDIIDCKTDDNDFGDFDWCSYVVDSIRNCKKGWRRGDQSSNFNGPLTILTLLYVDSITCPGFDVERTLRPLTFWTLDNLRRREAEELKNGGFGLGQFRGLFVDEKHGDNRDNEKCVDEDDMSKDLLKPTDLTGHLAKLESLYERNLKSKVAFEKALGEAKRLFPDNVEIGDLVEKYRSIYVNCVEFEETVTDKSQPTVEITSAGWLWED
ncbi:hypothetical protein L1987_65198 [Smallanthus sonchifolius]|uniref:Uncharacterized protein n=1 Tax=Smallanthus sonchifolius TaxID=185202 RepID=A0ACB9BTW6_9ASTR|nr:hypothetical protein L1987_65198 [Smallanthus sonchifolius]